MPKKKKTLLQETEEKIEEEIRAAGKTVKNVVTAIAYCGHINKQYHNQDNELEDLACTLEKGHAGEHSAEVEGRLNAWSDAAGKPARQHA
jgi:hypothetical protein